MFWVPGSLRYISMQNMTLIEGQPALLSLWKSAPKKARKGLAWKCSNRRATRIFPASKLWGKPHTLRATRLTRRVCNFSQLAWKGTKSVIPTGWTVQFLPTRVLKIEWCRRGGSAVRLYVPGENDHDSDSQGGERWQGG